MPRAMAPTREIDATSRLLSDPENPIFCLIDFVTKYGLPVKPLAAFLGIHPQTIYFWLAAEEDIRGELTTTKRMGLLLERLCAAEVAGQLELSGTSTERTQQLINALGEYPALEPTTT